MTPLNSQSHSQWQEVLVHTNSARELLVAAFKVRKNEGKIKSISQLGKAAGYSSRSFPREILNGRRHLTPQAASAFAQGLRLPTVCAERLKLLAEYESTKNIKEKFRLQKLIERNMSRIHQIRENKVIEQNYESLMANPSFSIVFASLGSQERGSSLADVLRKSKLQSGEVKAILKEMESLSLIICRKGRYFPAFSHVVTDKQKAKSAFYHYYLKRVDGLRFSAKEHFARSETLFWESTFSISKAKLPLLKERFREVLLALADEFEEAEGDEIVSITTGLFDPR